MQLFSKTYVIPNLVSDSDVMSIKETLDGSPGIDNVEIDLPSHQVHVVTANQDGTSDIEWLLRDMGFPPQEPKRVE